MTGNIVFLGFAVAGTPDFHVAVYMIAITAFLAGALVAGRTGKAFAGKPLRGWLLAAAPIETVLLWIAAGVPIGFDIATQRPETRLFLIIALTAMAMGARNATIRQHWIPDLTTTVITLTLTGLVAVPAWPGGATPTGCVTSAVWRQYCWAQFSARLWSCASDLHCR
jgi:uncharacterized membrane protein YoaK (UPF0700 family)